MANTYIPVEMDIGSNRIEIINIRSDVATYFGIESDTTAQEIAVTRRRKSHTRSRFEGLTQTTATTTKVSASEWKAVRKVANIGSGNLIRIPTKLVSGKNKNIRYTSFRVPGNAVTGAISNFIAEKFTKNKPDFFITETGTKYPVVRIYEDVNPGKS
jgi:hypothetical protein